MREIDKYTKQAIDGRSCNLIKYKREEKSYGITHVPYSFMCSKLVYTVVGLTSSFFWGLSFYPLLAVDGLKYAVFKPKFNHYFDTVSGELLGNSHICGSLSEGVKKELETVFCNAKENGQSVTLAFDKAPSGRQMQKVVSELAHAHQLICKSSIPSSKDKDWNEELVRSLDRKEMLRKLQKELVTSGQEYELRNVSFRLKRHIRYI